MLNIDYINQKLTNQLVKQDSHKRHNKEKYMLNINAFNKIIKTVEKGNSIKSYLKIL